MPQDQVSKIGLFTPTVGLGLEELPENLVAESENYLKELGFPAKSIFSVRNNELICMDSQPVYNHFTSSEKPILIGLIQNKNKLISYDQIGNLFWGEEESLEKFSLQSIAKIMGKIRKKIQDLHVFQEGVYTVRGQGYVLQDLRGESVTFSQGKVSTARDLEAE